MSDKLMFSLHPGHPDLKKKSRTQELGHCFESGPCCLLLTFSVSLNKALNLLLTSVYSGCTGQLPVHCSRKPNMLSQPPFLAYMNFKLSVVNISSRSFMCGYFLVWVFPFTRTPKIQTERVNTGSPGEKLQQLSLLFIAGNNESAGRF